VLIKGVSNVAMVLGMLICTLFVNLSLGLSHSNIFLLMNMLLLITACLSYEYERNNMLFFLQSKTAINVALERQETESVKEKAELERDAAAKVSRELRSKFIVTHHSHTNTVSMRISSYHDSMIICLPASLHIVV
jgi:hypothetical protein